MGEWDDAAEAAEDLQGWLDGGGFAPELEQIGWRNLMDGIVNVLSEVT